MQELIAKNKPIRVETAAGRVFEVPHRDLSVPHRKRRRSSSPMRKMEKSEAILLGRVSGPFEPVESDWKRRARETAAVIGPPKDSAPMTKAECDKFERDIDDAFESTS
jgi:hypothetical protein